jgi:pilus assembly protein Flp/PilA
MAREGHRSTAGNLKLVVSRPTDWLAEKKRERERTAMLNSIKRFLVSEDGPTAVEYAVMLALIVIVCLAAITTVGTNASAKFQEIGAQLA